MSEQESHKCTSNSQVMTVTKIAQVVPITGRLRLCPGGILESVQAVYVYSSPSFWKQNDLSILASLGY